MIGLESPAQKMFKLSIYLVFKNDNDTHILFLATWNRDVEQSKVEFTRNCSSEKQTTVILLNLRP